MCESDNPGKRSTNSNNLSHYSVAKELPFQCCDSTLSFHDRMDLVSRPLLNLILLQEVLIKKAPHYIIYIYIYNVYSHTSTYIVHCSLLRIQCYVNIHSIILLKCYQNLVLLFACNINFTKPTHYKGPQLIATHPAYRGHFTNS